MDTRFVDDLARASFSTARSALGDTLHSGCLLAQMSTELRLPSEQRIVLQYKGKLARPTRFERVTLPSEGSGFSKGARRLKIYADQ
jgi:hypothetical protein